VGYRPDEILGRSLYESVQEDHRDDVCRALREVFETGCMRHYEACDVHARRWYSTVVGPLYRQGEMVAAVQCSEDITEKQEIRRQLAESESRWRTLVENVPEIIVLIDQTGSVRFINRANVPFTKEEVLNRKGVEFVSAEDRPRLEKAIREVFENGESQDFEFTEPVNGRIYMTRIALIGSFEGEPMAIALCRDMTGERKARQQLLDSETQLRLAVQQAPVVLWTTNRELRFTSSMGAGLALIHAETNQNNGKTLFEYFGVDDPEFPAIKAHIGALEGRSVEYTQTWLDNVFQSHVEPLRDAAGEIVGVVGVALDVTARHATEVQLRQTSIDLEARVRERTAELDALNQQLLLDIEHRRVVEKELRQSEERFRVIVEALPIAVVIVRRSDRRPMYANRQVCELFATSRAELFSGKLQLPCGDESFFQSPVDEDVSSEARDFEIQATRADGTPIWILASVVGIQYQGEDAFICGMLDTTERKEAEEALIKERSLLTRLLDLNERDRQLIAYEIHDGFVQDVTAASMFLESAAHLLDAPDGPAAKHIQQSLDLLRESLSEARRMINGLRPPVLEEAGVVAAVEEMTSKFRDQFQLEIELSTSLRSSRMAPALEMAIYRIVQEALTNVHRHSGSTKARVSIEEADDRLVLEVEDWGVGFVPTATPKKRYGLTGMRERARLLGGHTVIDSQPGQGTRIRVDLPLVSVQAVESPDWLPLTPESTLD